MLPAQRRDELLRVLRTEGRVVARDVAERLGLSEDTVRRDLRDLAAAGLAQRVYGGALPVSPALADYAGRQTVAVESKDRVARRAAGLVTPGCTAILDGGTTALAVARALPPDLRATIVTHSPTVAAALAEHPMVDVLVLGGRLDKHSVVASGAITAEAAAGVWADVFLLGVTGVHPRGRAHHRERGGGGDQAHAREPGGRHLRPRQRREDRGGVAVPGAAARRRDRDRHGRAGGRPERPGAARGGGAADPGAVTGRVRAGQARVRNVSRYRVVPPASSAAPSMCSSTRRTGRSVATCT
jgi:DeoR/GlpR family transcriptional regulator of sugar metabolism